MGKQQQTTPHSAQSANLADVIRCREGDEAVRWVAVGLCMIEGRDPDELVSVNGGPFDRWWKDYQSRAQELLS